jgi:hypothetical protein
MNRIRSEELPIFSKSAFRITAWIENSCLKSDLKIGFPNETVHGICVTFWCADHRFRGKLFGTEEELLCVEPRTEITSIPASAMTYSFWIAIRI